MLYIEKTNVCTGRADDMERISVLLQKYKKIWFYVPENVKEDFCKEVSALGGCFSDEEALTADRCGRFMSVTKDGAVNYVAAMAWMAAKEPGNGFSGIYHNFADVPRITYEVKGET